MRIENEILDQYNSEWLAALDSVLFDKMLLDSQMSVFMRRLQEQKTIEFLTYTDQNMDHIYSDISYALWTETRHNLVRIDLPLSDIKRYIEVDRPNKNERKAVSFAKWIKERFDYKLSSELKSRIGNYFKLPDKRQIKVVFSMGCDGSASEYYHGNSCYWGSFATSRDLIEHNLGGAIRFYDVDSGDIISRSWFIPYDGKDLTNGIVIFNTYGSGGFDSMRNVADVVVSVLNAELQETSLYFEYDVSEYGDELLYLNSHHTYFVGTVWEKYNKAVANVELELPSDWKYGNPEQKELCEYCHNHFHEDDMYYVDYIGYSICESCLHENFTYVDRRDEYLPNDDVVEIRYCGHWEYFAIDDSEVVNIDGEYYHFEDCVCDEHGNWYAPDDTDSWIQIESGEIYPTNECEYNEEDEEWVYVG